MRWITITEIVDMDTGEIMTKTDQNNYITIKITKNVTFNEKKTIGTVKRTKHSRGNPQSELFTRDVNN